MEDPVVPLERNLNGHPLVGLLWERQSEEILLKLGWEKVRTWSVSLFTKDKDYSCRYTLMTSKWLEEAEFGTHVEEIDEECRYL